jgi:RES domain-containing protein
VIFYRITRDRFNTAARAFSGEGATLAAGRWNWIRPDHRAVYCSDSLALACLETLVHIRPLPRVFPGSIYYLINVPDALLERPALKALPPRWNSEIPKSSNRDFGTTFLASKRAVGLVVPTTIQPEGFNVVLNPLHPRFDLKWVKGPFRYEYDARLK